MKIPIFPGKYHQNGDFPAGYVSLQEGNPSPMASRPDVQRLQDAAPAERQLDAERHGTEKNGHLFVSDAMFVESGRLP